MNPQLRLLARPDLTSGMEDFLAKHDLNWRECGVATPAERLVEFAGRICYMSFGERQFRTDNQTYISNLISQGHGSVLEHVAWTVLLSGVSRAFTHQLVRHRVGFSFSQLSQQYHDEGDAQFIRPHGLERSPKAMEAWDGLIELAKKTYETIKAEFPVNAGLTSTRERNRALRSAARSVLPNATATIIVVTANARAIRHFLAMRGAIEGDYEMRIVSKLFYDLLKLEAPVLVSDFELRCLPDGSPSVVRLTPIAAESSTKSAA
ncbi:MAG TPA: FAD-dependent thymidylate synthase [Rhizomicrobium sp.]|jgi:thymidylate synthase (FAD)